MLFVVDAGCCLCLLVVAAVVAGVADVDVVVL